MTGEERRPARSSRPVRKSGGSERLIITDKSPRRLAVYVFHDAEGIVDQYVEVFLRGLREEVSLLRVVVNGSVDEAGRHLLEAVSDELMIRDNVGYDITAYREGLFKDGYEALCAFDEAVICNDTLYGPIHPFGEMFGAMAGRDLDFWGITEFAGVPYDPFGTIACGFIPRHVQSFFQVFRRDFMRTDDFRLWWENMAPITRYEEAIAAHEAVFTKAMEDKGYRWAVYCDCPELKDYTLDVLRDFPAYALRDKGCPVMKKRTFYQDYGEAFERSGGEAAREAFDYIKNETTYDEQLMVKNLLRTCHMADLKKRLHLNYIVPSGHVRGERTHVEKAAPAMYPDSSAAPATASVQVLPGGGMAPGHAGRASSLRTALMLYIYYDDLAEECASCASHMPSGTDIFVTVPDERKLFRVRPFFDELSKDHRIEFRVSGNRGRDVAPFLVTMKDVFFDYDLVLKLHDKKVAQIPQLSVGHAWQDLCFDCLLPSEEFALNVIRLFEDHPSLGILTPPVPVHGPYFPTTGHGEWGENYEVTRQTAEMLGIRAPMSPDREPVAPLGSEFWVRTEALRPLFAHDWELEDFPAEPVAIDGTLLHAIERLYPFAAQQAGFYSAWLLSDSYARIHMDNWRYMNGGLAACEAARTGGFKPFREFLSRVEVS